MIGITVLCLSILVSAADPDEDVGVDTSSEDWYKQMFHSLKQSVDDLFPDKKSMC